MKRILTYWIKPLPVGSTMDIGSGIFYPQPVPRFIGRLKTFIFYVTIKTWQFNPSKINKWRDKLKMTCPAKKTSIPMIMAIMEIMAKAKRKKKENLK